MKLHKLSIFTLLLFCLIGANARAEAPLVLTTHLVPPLGNDAGNGQVDKLIRRAFEKVGVEYKLERYKQIRSLELARDNKVDGHYGRIDLVAEANDNLIAVPYPIYKSHLLALSHDPDIKISGWRGLRDYKAFYLKGWKVFEMNLFSQRYARPIIGPDELANLFKQKKTDLILFEWGSFPGLINRVGVYEYYQASPILAVYDLHLLLNVKHQKLADQLAIILEDMHKNGEYQEICPICAAKLAVNE